MALGRRGSKKPAKRKTAAAEARPAEKPAAKKPAALPKKPAAARPKRAREPAAGAAATTPVLDRKSKLGQKWACYGCGSKFYDLNHPEPICPRCGTDQRTKPKDTAPPPPPPPRVREPRPLAPLLDDDDAATRDTALSGEDLDLEITGLDDEDAITEAPELDLEEEEEPVDED
jgi:hypothetical protein